MHGQCSSKGIYLTHVYKLELHIRTLAKISLKKLLEPERMQVFPLNSQFQKREVFSFYINKIIDKISEMNYACSLTSLNFRILCRGDHTGDISMKINRTDETIFPQT